MNQKPDGDPGPTATDADPATDREEFERLRRLMRIEGLEHLKALDGRPVILMMPHFTGLDLAGLASRGEADRRMAAAVPDAGVRAFLLQSLDLRADPPRWKLNLDQLEADMAGIIGFPEMQGRFDGPTAPPLPAPLERPPTGSPYRSHTHRSHA